MQAELQIKICGITQLQQAQALEKMGFDFIGFIFYPLSSRYVGNAVFNIKEMPAQMPTALRTAVFVNPTIEAVNEAVQFIPGIRVLQFHGDESPAFCALFAKEFTIIKAFQISENTDIEQMIQPYMQCCLYFLFDTKSAQYGGSGKKFNWDLLQEKKIDKPFFLSGGIGPDDVKAIQQFKHPFFYGIDLNSCFEKEPGVKDIPKLQYFIHQLKINQ